jgi:hypothetical protein
MGAVMHINGVAFGLIGLVAMLGLLGWGIGAILYYRNIKAKQREQLEAMPESDELPEPVLVPARVTVTRIHRFYTGSRRLRIFNEEFYVTFCVEGEREITCSVPRETYYAINEGDCGMLLHVNGNFLDFGEGKECDTAM